MTAHTHFDRAGERMEEMQPEQAPCRTMPQPALLICVINNMTEALTRTHALTLLQCMMELRPQL
jgi:hypothetical protein